MILLLRRGWWWWYQKLVAEDWLFSISGKITTSVWWIWEQRHFCQVFHNPKESYELRRLKSSVRVLFKLVEGGHALNSVSKDGWDLIDDPTSNTSRTLLFGSICFERYFEWYPSNPQQSFLCHLGSWHLPKVVEGFPWNGCSFHYQWWAPFAGVMMHQPTYHRISSPPTSSTT